MSEPYVLTEDDLVAATQAGQARPPMFGCKAPVSECGRPMRVAVALLRVLNVPEAQSRNVFIMVCDPKLHLRGPAPDTGHFHSAAQVIGWFRQQGFVRMTDAEVDQFLEDERTRHGAN